MALRADDRGFVGRVSGLLTLLAPSPGRWEFATRQAVICASTVLMAEFFQTPELALTVYIVFFINQSDRMTSIVMNGVMVLLITIVIGLVLVTAMLVIDQPAWRVVSIGMLSFVTLFLGSASKLRPVGTSIALIVGYGLDLLGTLHGGEIATRALLYAWLFVGIPAGVSIVVNLLIAPPPRRLAERALAHRLRLCAAQLQSAGGRTGVEFKACLEEGLEEVLTWIRLAGVEKTSSAEDIAALRSAAEATVAIQLLTDLATREGGAGLPDSSRGRIARLLFEMAEILRLGGYPVDIILERADDDVKLAPISRALLSDLQVALTRFAEAAPKQDPAPAAEKPRSGFFVPDAFSNPDHVRYALKTTGAAMFCFVLYSVLDWPSIHTCFITCYVVALSTTAEAVEKLTLRILGCLVGAAAGISAIVFLMPSVTSIGGLMAIVFGGAFIAAWVAGGSPRISYAGFQIAFAFFLCVIQGAAPAFDMVTARDRVIGILLGNLVSYLVFVYLWPVSVARRIDPAISNLLQTLGKLASTASLSARRGLAAVALASGGAAGQDLRLLAYEPQSLRPSPHWIRSRSRTLEDIAALTAPLLLAADQHSLHESVAARLSRGAKELGSGVTLAAQQSSVVGSSDLSRLVDRQVTAVEESLNEDVRTARGAEHALA